MISPHLRIRSGHPVAAPPSAIRSRHVSLRTIACASLSILFSVRVLHFPSPVFKHVLDLRVSEGPVHHRCAQQRPYELPPTIEDVVVKKVVETVYKPRLSRQNHPLRCPCQRGQTFARVRPCQPSSVHGFGISTAPLQRSRVGYPRHLSIDKDLDQPRCHRKCTERDPLLQGEEVPEDWARVREIRHRYAAPGPRLASLLARRLELT